jgi:hypothetical protein
VSAPTMEAGVIADMPEDEYHAHPALSSSGARRLLAPSCPALFRHEQLHGQQQHDCFDFGSAAHHMVLGTGREIYVVDAADWRTGAAKKEREAARAAGMIPLLTHEYDQAQAMADALRQHPMAAELLNDGDVEQSLFWTDAETGVACRARPDVMAIGRLVDYKTTADPSPAAVAKSVATYGYHQQADWYLTGAIALDLIEPDADFYFIFQGKTPPHLVTVIDLDDTALTVGRERNVQSRRIFRDCTAADSWPAWSTDIETVSLPAWALREHWGNL